MNMVTAKRWIILFGLIAVCLINQTVHAEKAYVVNQFENTVSVVDVATNAIVTSIPVGTFPTSIALNSSGTRAYVTNNGGTVSVVDTTNNSVITTIKVGSSPMNVKINPSGTRIYISNSNDDTVSVVDTSNNTTVATVAVGNKPFGVTVNPLNSFVYVTNSTSNSVSVIDTRTNSVVHTISVGKTPYNVASNQSGTRIYVANFDDNTVSVIDTSSNSIVNTIKVGNNPLDLVVNSLGTLVYVINWAEHTVSVIDANSYNILNTIPVGAGNPRNITINSSGTRVYVTKTGNSDDGISVIDTSTNKVLSSISSKIGSYPSGIAVFGSTNTSTTPTSTSTTSNQPPTASFTAISSNSTSGSSTVVLDASASNDPERGVLTYQWSSQPTLTISSGKNSTVVVSQAGTYIFTLRVTDDNGSVTSTSQTVTIPAATTSEQGSLNTSKSILTFSNTQLTQGVAVTNTGKTSLTISKITVEGVDKADFQTTGCEGTILAPSQNCTLAITLKVPVDPSRLRSANVSIISNAGNKIIQLNSDYPALTAPIAFDKAGKSMTLTNASMTAGLSINNQAFTGGNTSFSLADKALITAHITAADEHIASTSSMFIVGGYVANGSYSDCKNKDKSTFYYLLSRSGNTYCQAPRKLGTEAACQGQSQYSTVGTTAGVWNGSLATLGTLDDAKNITLTKTPVELKIWEGNFDYAGVLCLWFGYRLTDGTVVISGESLNLTITPNSTAVNSNTGTTGSSTSSSTQGNYNTVTPIVDNNQGSYMGTQKNDLYQIDSGDYNNTLEIVVGGDDLIEFPSKLNVQQNIMLHGVSMSAYNKNPSNVSGIRRNGNDLYFQYNTSTGSGSVTIKNYFTGSNAYKIQLIPMLGETNYGAEPWQPIL